MRILHLDSNHPHLIQKLADAGFSNDEDYRSSKEQIEQIIASFDGIVIRSRFKIDRQFIDAAKNLKFIARVGAGLESIDVDYATEKNIKLIAAPEGNRNAVAEHALAMLLALFNKINIADREIRSGHWNRESNRGHELDGKVVGLIGYGNMGKAFAKKLRGFDVEVLFHDILEGVGDSNANQVTLNEIRQRADVLSLHVPWTPETDKMIDAEFISGFEKPFWLINTSRGKNVVTADLVSAIESGKILGAALDVLEYEKLSFESLFEKDQIPEPLQYLIHCDKVVLSPHVAGWTFESHERLASVIAEKIINFSTGEQKTEAPKKRVTGIGGFFFKAKNPKQLMAWYKDHLGLNTDDYGWSFWWKDQAGNDGMTQWSIFSDETKYLDPSEKPFMQNFRVQNLEDLLVALKAEGIEAVGEMQSFDYGKFCWIMDPEGNKIELWEPVDSAFK